LAQSGRNVTVASIMAGPTLVPRHGVFLRGRALLAAFSVTASRASPSASYHGRLLQANCTEASCNNAENMCGKFTLPCHKVGNVPSGPAMWVRTVLEFGPDFSYRRSESCSFNLRACERGDIWLAMIMEGRFTQRGGSPYRLGQSLASIEVVGLSLKLVKDKICFDQVTGRQQCYDARLAVQQMCPCNGWDWSTRGEPLVRNIGMFCGPRDQCPLLYDMYLGQTNYLSYNATVASACFSKVASDEERGWRAPQHSACADKEEPATCMRGQLSGTRRRLQSLLFLLFGLVLCAINPSELAHAFFSC